MCIPFRPLHNGQIRVKRVAQILSEFKDKSILEITTKLAQGWYECKKNCDKKIYHLPGTSLEGGEGGGSKVTLAEALAAQSFYNVKNG